MYSKKFSKKCFPIKCFIEVTRYKYQNGYYELPISYRYLHNFPIYILYSQKIDKYNRIGKLRLICLYTYMHIYLYIRVCRDIWFKMWSIYTLYIYSLNCILTLELTIYIVLSKNYRYFPSHVENYKSGKLWLIYLYYMYISKIWIWIFSWIYIHYVSKILTTSIKFKILHFFSKFRVTLIR